MSYTHEPRTFCRFCRNDLNQIVFVNKCDSCVKYSKGNKVNENIRNQVSDKFLFAPSFLINKKRCVLLLSTIEKLDNPKLFSFLTNLSNQKKKKEETDVLELHMILQKFFLLLKIFFIRQVEDLCKYTLTQTQTQPQLNECVQ